MSDQLRPTEFIWNGHTGLARHDRVEILFSTWPPTLFAGRAVSYLLFIPCTKQFEIIEGGVRKELAREDKAAVFAWLKGFASAGQRYFTGA